MTAELIALTDELRATTAMLGMVADRLDAADARARRHRFGSWVLAAVVAGVVVLGVVFWQDQVNERYRTCIRSNEIRDDIRESIVNTVEVIISGTADPDSLRPLLERVEANLLETLPDREC